MSGHISGPRRYAVAYQRGPFSGTLGACLAGSNDEIEIGDEIEIRYCRDELTARSVERFLIERFKPPRNRQS